MARTANGNIVVRVTDDIKFLAEEAARAHNMNLSGTWRYRVGDYRILAEIQDDVVLIVIMEVGHRREIHD